MLHYLLELRGDFGCNVMILWEGYQAGSVRESVYYLKVSEMHCNTESLHSR